MEKLEKLKGTCNITTTELIEGIFWCCSPNNADRYKVCKQSTVKPAYNGPVYGGRSGYNGHLAISYGWLLYTALTVVVLSSRYQISADENDKRVFW